MRLIDADAWKADIDENYVFTGFKELREDVIQSIDAQPTVDAVPVIRCKDCKRWRRSKSDTTVMVCDWDRYERTENDYCSWAKRKDDD